MASLYDEILCGVNFPDELAAIALASCSNQNVKILPFNIGDVKSLEKTTASLKEWMGLKPIVTMIGTYWVPILPELQKEFPEVHFIIGCGQRPSYTSDHVTYVVLNQDEKKGDYLGPLDWMKGRYFEDSSMERAFLQKFESVIRLMDQRHAATNIVETQIFLSGFYQANPDTHDELTKWKELFDSHPKYNLEDIAKMGKIIYEMQQSIVENRILKNSKVVTLPNDELAYAVIGSEYCNIMHDQLKKKIEKKEGKNIKVTMTVHPEFDQIRISLRSIDGITNVAQYARDYFGGDGSTPSAAGGSISFSFQQLLDGSKKSTSS